MAKFSIQSNSFAGAEVIQHEIITYPKRILYPVARSKHAAAIARAVKQVVGETKPRTSYCYCGKNCAVNRKHVALLEKKRKHST